MSRHPDAEWIPMAWAFPGWFIRPRVNIIEAACDAWEDATDVWGDQEEEATA